MIDIIHPPPDVHTIVEKTTQFVAKNGLEFEKCILANNTANAKFNFLSSSNPYHAYYQHRISKFAIQLQSSTQQIMTSQPANSGVPKAGAAAPAMDGKEDSKTDASALFKPPVRKVLEPPEAEQYTVRLPEGITGEELDIIKLIAQFVAHNGKTFMTGLSSREINNPRFHFLKPTHSMFFIAPANSYSKVLMPPKGLIDKLRKIATYMTTMLERCLHHLEWERLQEDKKQKI